MPHINSNKLDLDVPFIENTGFDCGPKAIEMVARFFGITTEFSKIKELASPYADGVTSSFGLARAAAELGLKVQYSTAVVGLDPEVFELPYYKLRGISYEMEQAKMRDLIDRCRELGGTIKQGILPLQEILTKMNKSTIPIILVDSNVLFEGKPEYEGHFLPIVGFDKDSVFVHHSGPINPCPRLKICHELLEKARSVKGTDWDVLFLSCR